MVTQTTRDTLDLGDGALYYEVAGEGEPLVLAHAGFVDSRMWDDQWDAFSQRYRTIRYDMRGFGRSSRLEAPIARRNDLYRLLEHLGIARAVLLGCSMSGEIAIDIALERPDLVSALIVVSATPSGFEMRGAPPPDLLEMIGALQQGDLARASELQTRIWLDGPFRQPGEVSPQLRARVAEMNQIAVANQTWMRADVAPLQPLSPSAAQRLGSIQVPTLIIAGGLDHPEILRAADLMAGAIPGAQAAIMPGCAHVPNMEQPATFNQIVLEFLRNRA